MTPKEKSIDVLSRVVEQLLDSGFRISKKDVIKISLFCCDEVIKVANDTVSDVGHSTTDYMFWEEVKREIENL